MASNYARGAAFEYRVRDALVRLGYPLVIRAAGSHGLVDLIALHPARILLVQCKRNGQCPPAERVELEQLADALCEGIWNFVPVLAAAPKPRAGIRWSLVENGQPVHDPDLRPRPL